VNDLVVIGKEKLTPAQFSGLADVPPELEWLANITNPKTRRADKIDVAEFSAFTGLSEPAQLRGVTRAHIIAWRKHLELRDLTPASIRRKLSALSSLFDYLCERNAVLGNPVDGVKRPMANNNEGSTPAMGDAQVRRLLEAPCPGHAEGCKGPRDSRYPALSRHPARRALSAAPARYAEPPGRHALPHQGQARQAPVCSRSPDGAKADRGISGGRETRRGAGWY